MKQKIKIMSRIRSLFHDSGSKIHEPGITLLLVILVLSALMTVSLGIFNISFIELRISGDLSNSMRALYASDQMVEYGLYRDRIQGAACGGVGQDCYTACTTNYLGCANPDDSLPALPSGACGKVVVSRFGGQTTLQSTGQYDCDAGSLRLVRRAFQVVY